MKIHYYYRKKGFIMPVLSFFLAWNKHLTKQNRPT
jgi:hypothetical protein